jgi:phospholipid/cholesterol/gamma-HCH transport system substrate-binding protein
MKNSLETRIGIFVALVVLAAVFILDIVGGPEKFARGIRLHTMFHNVQDLKVGDRVKMAGVEIGRVEDIRLTNDVAMVTFKVKKEAGVKTDSTAAVQFTGLMGQNYVALSFGTPDGTPAIDGAVLGSTERPDLSALVAKLDNVASGVENLTKSFTGDKIDNLLGPFTDFLKANQEPLTATIANLKSISAQIAQGQGTVGKLIYDDSLYNSALYTVTNLQSATEDLGGVIAGANEMIEGVNKGEGTLGKLAKDETLYNHANEFMTNMVQISQKINQGNGTVGKLINDPEFYKNAKMTLQKIDKGADGLEDQGPLSVLGIIVNSLL